MNVIATILERLALRRLVLRARQGADLWHNELATVYPCERRITRDVPERVVVVTPHADDETFGAGGAIALHVMAGHEIHVICCSDNRASVPGGAALEVIRMRNSEYEAAMALLGVQSFDMLALPDEAFTHAENHELAKRIIGKNPSLLYLPSIFDNHEHHRVLNRWITDVLAQRDGTIFRVRGYEVWSPCIATAVVDIDAVAEQKRAAIRAYRSQSAALPYERCIDGLNAYRALTLGGSTQRAEAFLELSAAEYRRLIQKHT